MNLSCKYETVFHDNQQSYLNGSNDGANVLDLFFVFELSLQQ